MTHALSPKKLGPCFCRARSFKITTAAKAQAASLVFSSILFCHKAPENRPSQIVQLQSVSSAMLVSGRVSIIWLMNLGEKLENFTNPQLFLSAFFDLRKTGRL